MFNELSELHGEHSKSSARKRAMAGLVQDVTDRPGAGKGSSSTAPLSWLVNSWKIGEDINTYPLCNGGGGRYFLIYR